MPVKRKTRRKPRRKTSPRQPDPMQGWVWGVFGLGIGLSVAALIYMNNRPSAALPAAPVPQIEEPPARAKRSQSKAEPAAEPSRFRFYDMLPNFEVVIPEQDKAVIRAKPVEAIADPGVYVLQAGSFSAYADADRRKAQLGMLGIPSSIQKVAVDDKVYHRVRIGPVDSLTELNAMRGQLRSAKIDAMVIRVGE
jgi:cell division protein FtsN